MKVDFFIAGGPKCGTTALATYLDSHPEVCFARPKEPWFFNDDLNLHTIEHNRLPEQYHALCFSHYDPEKHTCSGEGTPLYLMSDCAINKILEYNPDARFIVMLRNPVDMVQSWHSQLIFNGKEHEDVEDFRAAWDLQQSRRQGHNLPEPCQEPRQLQYKEVCSLGTQLEKLYAKVPRERVLPILLEDLIRDPRGVYLSVEEFIGVNDDGRSVFEKVNANKKVRSHWLKTGLQKINRLKKRRGFSFSLGIGKYIRKFNYVSAGRKLLEPDLIEELKLQFENEVIKLENILSRDFSHWK